MHSKESELLFSHFFSSFVLYFFLIFLYLCCYYPILFLDYSVELSDDTEHEAMDTDEEEQDEEDVLEIDVAEEFLRMCGDRDHVILQVSIVV